MNIETASGKDIDRLFALVQLQFHEHGIRFDSAELRAAIAHLLAHDRLGFILIAREDSQSVGFAVISFAWTLEHGGMSAWLDELYVLPDRRDEGIGTALLERLFVEVNERGCLAVDLEVEAEHRKAENLYRRMGFQKLKRRRWVKPLR